MRKERGVVATEAVLSFALLLVALLTLWSAVRLIYEKTSLETAAQISSQSGVTYFLRNTPISCDPDREGFGFGGPIDEEGARCQEGYDESLELMWSIFEKNVCDDDRLLGNENESGAFCNLDEEKFVVTLDCKLVPGESVPETQEFSEDACLVTDDSKRTARALIVRFTVQGEVEVDGGFLDLVGDTFSTESSSYGWRRLN